MLLASVPSTVAAASAEAGVPAGLFYSSDDAAGITRERKGDVFVFRDTRGKLIKKESEIARIRKLAIPPAYESVWICPSPNGHLQATGRDARGRKQYRYHARWREERDTGKFDRLLEFAAMLPRLRKKVQQHLKGNALSRELVLATIVRLLDTTLVRVGNDQYARENKSFGLTTLQDRHASFSAGGMTLAFKGKSGVQHEVRIDDARVSRIVKRCKELPGQELFQYRDEQGEVRAVSSGDVNDFLEELCGERFTAKDFRTWHGSALALDTVRELCGRAACGFTLKELLAEVSGQLGNTPAVCRKAYIHPSVLVLGTTLSAIKENVCFDDHVPASKDTAGLSASERRLVAFLRKKS